MFYQIADMSQSSNISILINFKSCFLNSRGNPRIGFH
uniref:Uncharacterized protein n=1 Tax=Rhizophora mucronata TaxID=61149 RepID=A0A2P2NSK7_RHIMU